MRILIPGLFLGTFTCGTSHGSSALIYRTGMMGGKRMMPRPKKLVTVRRENNVLIFYSFLFPIIERKTVANVARISVILEGHLEMRKSVFRIFQFLGTQIHALQL